MRELPFTTFQDVNRRRRGRPIVYFGAGPICAKTRRRITEQSAAIADNNSSLWGSEEDGLPVRSPEFLKQEGKAHFVVICTTSFGEVAAQLSGFGLAPGEDFVVSPILNDLRIIYEMESYEARLLFSSGAPELDAPEYGGGIYELIVKGTEIRHRKVFSGTCYGLWKQDDFLIAVDHKRGLTKINSNLEIVQSSPLPAACSPHGVTFSEKTSCYYVVASYLDAVLVFDKDLNPKGEISISNKMKNDGAAGHHCNDAFAMGNSLFMTMFSFTGNWKKEVFDGGILEIEIPSGKVIGPVVSDLWMPHNVTYLAGSLTVLDSLRGRLLRNNAQTAGQFPGFSRGLAYDGIHFLVGQSRNRNFSRCLGVSNNISIDTSIIVFDEQTKVSRSLPLPQKLSEIHSIVCL